MKKEDNLLLEKEKEIKSDLKTSITVTGIYIATTVAYNLVRDPSFIDNSIMLQTMDTILSNPVSIYLGTTLLTAFNTSNVVEYRKIKKQTVKTIGTKK